MASFNITRECLCEMMRASCAEETLLVEDHSPLVTYTPAGAWTDTPANDSLTSVCCKSKR